MKFSKAVAIILISLLTVLAGCDRGQLASRLDAADSTLEKNPEQAYQTLFPMKDSVEQHASKSDRMRYQLLLAQAQNKTNRSILGIDTLKEIVNYYGKGEQKMRALYMVGSKYRDLGDSPNALEYFLKAASIADTTSKDCNFKLVGTIYQQAAFVYDQQRYPQKELEMFDKAAEMAQKAGDKVLNAICVEMEGSAYDMLGKKDEALRSFLKGYNLMKAAGDNRTAARVEISIMGCYLDKGDLKKAKEAWDEYYHCADLFDKTGNIEEGREISYHALGRYYEATGALDSAEIAYRKLFKRYDIENYEAGCNGLLSVYGKLKQTDSVMKYARLYAAYNDSVNFRNSAEEVSRTASLYNYNQFKEEAFHKDIEKNHWRFLTLCALMACLLLYLYISYRKRMDKKEIINVNQNYARLLENYSNAKKDLETLRGNYNQFALDKEKEIKDLHLKLLKFHETDISYEEAIAKDNFLLQHSIVKSLHERATKVMESVTDSEWNEFYDVISVCLPSFCSFLRNKDLSSNEIKVCYLTKAGFIQSEIFVLLDISRQNLTNMRRRLNLKLFNKEGAREFDKNIQLL